MNDWAAEHNPLPTNASQCNGVFGRVDTTLAIPLFFKKKIDLDQFFLKNKKKTKKKTKLTIFFLKKMNKLNSSSTKNTNPRAFKMAAKMSIGRTPRRSTKIDETGIKGMYNNK